MSIIRYSLIFLIPILSRSCWGCQQDAKSKVKITKRQPTKTTTDAHANKSTPINGPKTTEPKVEITGLPKKTDQNNSYNGNTSHSRPLSQPICGTQCLGEAQSPEDSAGFEEDRQAPKLPLAMNNSHKQDVASTTTKVNLANQQTNPKSNNEAQPQDRSSKKSDNNLQLETSYTTNSNTNNKNKPETSPSPSPSSPDVHVSSMKPNINPVIRVDTGIAGKPKQTQGITYEETGQNDSVYYHGADACFIKGNAHTNQWDAAVLHGYHNQSNSSDWSREMGKHIRLSQAKTPKEKLWDAYNKTITELKSLDYCSGATTVCIVTIDRSGLLEYANLGYCRCKVIRQRKVVFETKIKDGCDVMSHALGQVPSVLLDTPDACISGKYQLQKEDILVMGTDGLFDNLDDEKIINEIQPDISAEISAQDMVNNLTTKAFEISQDEHVDTPYSREIAKIRKYVYTGGHPDDITVVVAVIK